MINLFKVATFIISFMLFIPLHGVAQTEPTLVIPVRVPADAGGTVTMPVTYTANGNAISTLIFSVDIDETNLDFDPASTTGFPWPDAITVNPAISPFVYSVGITYDANDTDGELDFTFADINAPLSALPAGDIVTITFTAGNPAVTTDAPVVFSLDPTTSFGNTDGESVPGITSDGSVLITVVCTPTGTPETVCNGVDDDCDDLIDEDFAPATTTCGTGECAATGQTTCFDGVEGDTCFPGTPTAEICDNLDNDCDGAVDEDYMSMPTTCGVGECASTGQTTCVAGVEGDTCTPGTPGAEVCDNLDNDCDGSTDEDLTRPTSCGVGECAGNTGEETCTAGTWGDETCDPFAGAVPEGPPGDATCGDTLDNDCDGQTDLADPGCDAACTPTGTPETVCNGVDDDCDGAVDEDYMSMPTSCGVGECASAGQTTCDAGVEGDTCTPGSPGAEVCDNLDNDCDGSTDEDLTRPTTCGVGECAGNTGEETCTAGTWGNDTCDPLTGAMPEGPPGDATCGDTLDNDCDGLTDSEDIDCQEAKVIELFDWGFYIDGITYCLLGPCDFDVDDIGNITGPEDLPSFIDISNFDFMAGLGSISITLADPGSHSVVMFVDHDIDVDLNDFDNETGFANGNPEMGQTWEIDEPGSGSFQDGSEGFPYFGDIFFDNFLDGLLDNQAFFDAIDQQTLTPPDDVSMGIGRDFELVEGESATVLFLLGDTSVPQGFHLVHRDPDSDVNIHFSGSLDVSGSQCTPTGEPETICNGIDDDCDDLIDEDFQPGTTTCGAGECAATGQSTCVDGVEGDTCTPGTPVAEVCDNLDNDCDGSTDEDMTRPTTCGVGECAGNTGTETCTAGTWGGDTCDPLAGATAEVCDNLDNDCDGPTDESLARPTICGTGECAGNTGEETCTAGTWGGDTCDPLAGATAEVCDNLDNDCDGSTDEDLTRPTTCGVGECAGNTGEETCTVGKWGGDTCDPLAGAMPEGPTGNMTCSDGIDNDCDGLADTDDTNCEKVGADVFLTKLKAPESVKIKKGKKKTKKIKAFGVTDTIAQEATVDLTVNMIDAVTVHIKKTSRTKSLKPGHDPKKFKFKADISCNETGTWKLHWTATIDAPQNADTSNDTMTASTMVTCKKQEDHDGWKELFKWKIKAFIWYIFDHYFDD